MITDQPTIHIVDDDRALAESNRMLLSMLGMPIRIWPSGEAFLEGADLSRPGCVLMDLQMPGMSGLEVHEELIGRNCPLPVIFLTAHGTVPAAVKALHAGAVDFLEKPVEAATLRSLVLAQAAKSVAVMATKTIENDRRRRFETLTPRERDVTNGILRNLTNKDISRELGVEVSTVKMHRANVFAKLGIHSTGELWSVASEAHLIPEGAVAPKTL